MSVLADSLLAHGRRRGARLSLLDITSGRRLSFKQILDDSGRAANLLRRRGLRAGQRVLLALENGPELLQLLFGAARLGATAVPADPRLTARELAELSRQCAPALTLDASAGVGLAKALSLEPTRWSGALPRPSAPFLILHTSGTTGRPKGVVLSHGAVHAKLEALRRHFGHGPSTRSLCLLPLSFSHALISNVLAPFHAGGAVLLGAPFGLERLGDLWTLLERHEATTFSSVPTILRLLLLHRARRARPTPPSLRYVTCASAPLPEETAAEFERVFGVPVLNCYGTTETASWLACQSLDAAGRRPGTVGRPIGDYRVRVLDERGRPLQAGRPGQLAVRGSALTRGYFRNAKLTARALRRGWFLTGDRGRFDDSGCLTLLGRLDDRIIRAGVKVDPREIDAVMECHPAVLESHTMGVADDLLGQSVACFVALKSGRRASPGELLAHCRGRAARFKGPDRIVLVPKLPRSERGKIHKEELLAWT